MVTLLGIKVSSVGKASVTVTVAVCGSVMLVIFGCSRMRIICAGATTCVVGLTRVLVMATFSLEPINTVAPKSRSPVGFATVTSVGVCKLPAMGINVATVLLPAVCAVPGLLSDAANAKVALARSGI